MKEIDGDLIQLAKEGYFDVITHGCNCFCTMSAGIALGIKQNFYDAYYIDSRTKKGDINKLGNYTSVEVTLKIKEPTLFKNLSDLIEIKKLKIINAYTQYKYGKNHLDGVENPFDYEAFTLCMRKINYNFIGQHIGLPKIGAGLAGGDWNRIKSIIEKELKDMEVTIVNYKK